MSWWFIGCRLCLAALKKAKHQVRPSCPRRQILSFFPPWSQSKTEASPSLYHILLGLAYAASVGFLVDLVETGRRVISYI